MSCLRLGDPWGQRAKEEMIRIKPEYHAWIVHREAEKLDAELQQKFHEDFVGKINRSYEHYQKGADILRKRGVRGGTKRIQPGPAANAGQSQVRRCP